MKQSNHKIVIITVYFGQWPVWLDHFLISCEQQPLFEFVLFSNIKPKCRKYKNVKFQELPVKSFESLIDEKLNLKVRINDNYKICDFKPAFGVLFEEYIENFDYWAYTDIDLVFGNTCDIATKINSGKYDVISCYKGYASGPLCFYRNQNRINHLYKEIRDYKKILKLPKTLGIDEHVIKNVNRGWSFKKFLLLVEYLAIQVLTLKIWKLKDNFQWYVKKRTINQPVDITEVIRLNTSLGYIRSHFGNYIVNDTDYSNTRNKKWRIHYKDGTLRYKYKEIMAFHFRELKKRNNFIVEKANMNSGFYISETGIYNE